MEPHFEPAVRLLSRLAAREMSSRELLEHFLNRVESHNPEVNAVVTLDPEQARRAADRADQALARGGPAGALHGLPMTVKDTLETEGLRTTAGAPELAGHVPARDADAVARLRSAGAIIFGKTNTPIYASDVQTFNPVFGVTSNPWDLARIPGGSSGGAAAALAAGLTGLELGSDIGGSIRNPAHFCGVFGHKPSWGLVSARGHIPYPPGWLSSQDVGVVGPLGRSAADLELALAVLAAPAPAEAVAWRLELPPPRRSRLREYRMGCWLDDPALPVDRAVLEVLEAAVSGLRQAGAAVEAARPAVDAMAGQRLWERLVWPVFSVGMSAEDWRWARGLESEPSEGESRHRRWGRTSAVRHRDRLLASEEGLRARSAWAEFFRDHDVLLCPVVQVAAPPHDNLRDGDDRTLIVNGEPRPYWDCVYWCGMFGAAGLPAAAVPVGLTGDGLPIGIQVVGPYLEDRTVLHVAACIEEVLGGFRPPPGF
jgi:amidase